jgi:peptidylprolyl isomerase
LQLEVTDKVYLDIHIGQKKEGRIKIGLFGKANPKTVANFRTLCEGSHNGLEGDPLTYRGSPIHRIIPGFMLQGGDIHNGNGTGGESIYGKRQAKVMTNSPHG